MLPRQAGAGDRQPPALTAGTGVCAGRWAVAAAVGVHPGEKVLRPPLVEAVVARHSAAPTAHLDQGVALGVVACHGDAASSRSLRHHLRLEWSGEGGRGGGRYGSGGGWIFGG